jgi:hypothetical protein
MKKGILKKIVLSVVCVVTLLFGVLVYHIHAVTRAKNDFRTTRQLSRIDFTEAPDSAEATRLRYYVAGMDGIQSTYYNYASHILVYTFSPEKQSSDKVFDAVMKHGNYHAKKYEVSEQDLAKGCPAMSQSSLSYRSARFVSSIFN